MMVMVVVVGTYQVADGLHCHVLVVVEVTGDAVVWGLIEWLTNIVAMFLWWS